MGKKKGEKSSNVILVNKPQVINVDYQLLIAERDDLLEAEIGYKRRIEQLEKDAAETLKSFDILYNENKILRSKLETPEGVNSDSIESYNAVFKDREHLKEANRAFKRRIRQLEDDAEEAQKAYNQLYQNHQLVTQKAQLETEFATRAKDDKINDMEQENEEINRKLQMFLKEREQYESRILEMDKDHKELQNKYDIMAEEKHEYQLRCEVLQADREKLKETVMDLEEKVPDPEVKAKEEQQFLSLQAQLVALQVSNTDATKEIHSLKEEIRVLNKMKRENVEMVDRALSAIIDEEEEENERQRKERHEEVEFELEENKKRSMHLLKENDRLKSEAVTLESKLANSELMVKELQESLNARTKEVEDMSVLVKSGESLNDDFLAIQEKVKDLSALRQALENELIQEKKISKLKVMELEKDLEKKTDTLNELDKKVMKMEGDNHKLIHENDTLEKVTEAQALELKNMKAQLEQIQNILEDKSTKYEEMKKTEKENQQELKESRLQLHIAQRELEELRQERAGNFSILRSEMETARDERKEETEQMRHETIRLREEVKRLKEYEYKITTMDSEIRRLMNRLRMTEKLRKLPPKKPAKPEEKKGDKENDEVAELKAKQRELQREKMVLLQEKHQWEILKGKHEALQTKNRNLVEENKRIRGDLEGFNYRIDTLEKRYKRMNLNPNVEVPEQKNMAVYIEKSKKIDRSAKPKNKSPEREEGGQAVSGEGTNTETPVKRGRYLVAKKIKPVTKPVSLNKTEHAQNKTKSDSKIQRGVENKPDVDMQESTEAKRLGLTLGNIKKANDSEEASKRLTASTLRNMRNKPKERRRFERKSTRTVEDLARMRSTRPLLPTLEVDSGLKFGKGYKEIHRNKYKHPQTLQLL